jgi:hypothetical protein
MPGKRATPNTKVSLGCLLGPSALPLPISTRAPTLCKACPNLVGYNSVDLMAGGSGVVSSVGSHAIGS